MIFLGALIGMLIAFPVGLLFGVYGMYNQIDKAAKSESKGWTCCGRLYEIREIFKKQD